MQFGTYLAGSILHIVHAFTAPYVLIKAYSIVLNVKQEYVFFSLIAGGNVYVVGLGVFENIVESFLNDAQYLQNRKVC